MQIMRMRLFAISCKAMMEDAAVTPLVVLPREKSLLPLSSFTLPRITSPWFSK